MTHPRRRLTDTHPAVTQAQIDLLRQAGPRRRAALAAALTTFSVNLARLALRRLHPEWSEAEIRLEWVRIHYGSDLAGRVRAHLAKVRPT